MTETCGGCVYDGEPLDGVRVRIGDDERIWLGGPVLFTRYRGAAGEPEGGWFRTGDLGRLDEPGRLTVRGRADDVINTGGTRWSRARSRPRWRAARASVTSRWWATRPGMGRTGRRVGGPGRSGRPAGSRIAPSACVRALAALRCSKQGRNGRCGSHALQREARHRTLRQELLRRDKLRRRTLLNSARTMSPAEIRGGRGVLGGSPIERRK